MERDFISPPDSAQAHPWWHWMNGNAFRSRLARIGGERRRACLVPSFLAARRAGAAPTNQRNQTSHEISTTVLVNRDSVRRSLGCLKGQDAGFPSDLVFTWRGTAHQEGGTTFFGSKISS
jgi:hypothetical protein